MSVLIRAVEELEPEIQALWFQAHHAPTRFEKCEAIEALGEKEDQLKDLLFRIYEIGSSETAQYLRDLMERSNVNIQDFVITLLANGVDETPIPQE
ncbi:MAG: hypothetical protein HC772_16025 [Leptolyngbyaceae cyanobacterium CRU_2_3]|nr:hypothetical protein [Leptolyngbyaceae cyanobacterium CRU_2_3]